MSARSELAEKIKVDAPDTWNVYSSPRRLRTFSDSSKTVAVVVEQRSLATDRFSSDGVEIPVGVALAVWVIVDGSRGANEDDLEDLLEGATEDMIRILEPLREWSWNGTAERTAYDEQKPAYQFDVILAGRIAAAITDPTEGD